MEAHRKGKITEYRQGTYMLTHIQWEDGHEEIELHQCAPQLMFQSFDPKDIDRALDILKDAPARLDNRLLPVVTK